MSKFDDFEDILSDDEDVTPELSPFERLSADRQRLIKIVLPLLFASIVVVGIVYQQINQVDHVAMSATETVQAIERFESAAIEINGPFSGQMFNVGTTIFFSWDWLRPLNQGEQFVVRLDGDEIGRIDQAQNNTFYRLEVPTDAWEAGEYDWSVTLEGADIPAVSATFLMTDTVIASTPTIPAPATPTPLATSTP